MSDLRTFTLWARELLTREARNSLQQVYLLDAQSGARLPVPTGHLVETSAEAQANRQRIEKLLDDEVDAGVKREEAIGKLIKETAFTHLNRLVAFKLMEARGLVRSPLAKHHAANGFKMWLGNNPAMEQLYNQGDSPNDRDGFGEAPRDRAYRHFLLWQSGELAKEIKVLFDPNNVPSLLFPRPDPLKELIDMLNSDERRPDWADGNEETVGWVYQYFNAEEKAAAFDKVFKKKKKFEKADLPAATQVFTPRWIVRFLVENSLGRMWLSMHPQSPLRDKLLYLVPLQAEPSNAALKAVKDVRILDPATGTMHFGLVAFELLVEMYREEMAHAGTEGWTAEASVRTDADIPAAILANNLFGIDIDLRASQLAALALYLKAKGTHKQAVLRESNLACADVAIFRGQHLNKIIDEMALPRGFTRELFGKFRDGLEEASMMGSLVRLEKHFQGLHSAELRRSIDAYVAKKRNEGVDESYFANESDKGLRLLTALEQRYDVVFTNPPYMSNRNMNPGMSDFMKANYKKSKGDLYSAFIERCGELLQIGGRLAMITQQSFMFISSFEDLRAVLSGATAIETMAHLGPRAFVEVTGEKVNTTAFVLRREQLEMNISSASGVYFRLVKEPDADSKRTAFEEALDRRSSGQPDTRIYEYLQSDFSAISGSPWVYWITPGIRSLFKELKSLIKIAEPRQGLATADNFRFLKFWWEVGKPRIRFDCKSEGESLTAVEKWYPYMKGGTFLRWYGNQEYIINYGRNGYELKAWADPLYGNSGWSRIIKSPEFYFRRGVTYSYLTAGAFSARLSPGGFIFDVAGSSLFPVDVPLILALLNSTFAQFALKLINPTVNFQVGDLARLPVPKLSSNRLANLVEEAIAFARTESEADETTYDFVEPPSWPDGITRVTARHRELAELERDIDEEAFTLYEISPKDRKAIEDELALVSVVSEDEDDGDQKDEESTEDTDASLSIENLAQRWVSYAVGIALGRFVRAGLDNLADADGLMVIQRDHPDDLGKRVIDVLSAIHGDAETGRIIQTVTGWNGDLRDSLAIYLLGPFFKAHVKRFRKRPVYWLLQSPKQNYSAYVFQERANDQTLAVLQGAHYLGGRIFQVNQLLKDAKQKEASSEGREKARWRRQAQDLAEELADLEAFDKAIESTNNEPIVTAEGHAATARWIPEFDDGVLLNAAPLYRLTPAWKKADGKLDLSKAWKALKDGEYPWARTAMRYWPRDTLAACKNNKSYRIAHGLE